MADYTTFSVETDADGIALMTIDVPNQGMNVIDENFMAEMPRFFDAFIASETMTGLVIASGRKNAFMAGADLRMLEKQDGTLDKAAFEAGMTLNRAFRKLETGGHTDREIQREGKKAKPVAVALEGLALGGGLELALAGHYRVVADSPKVKLGLPEVLVGLLPGGGGTQRVPRLIGLQNAAQMITTGTNLNAQKAKAQGLVHEVVEPGTTIDAAKAWVKDNMAGTLQPWDVKGFKVPGGAGATNPKAVQFFSAANAMALAKSKDNFPAIKAIMSCLYEGTMLPMSKAIEVETKYFLSLFGDPVAKNMIRTLFVNKQAAEKGAGRPDGIDKVEIRKVGVLGAGLMGSGIAHVTAKAGMEVISLDRTDEEAQKSVAYTKKILDKRVKRGRMTQEKADAFLARITPTSNYDDLKDVDLIIEAVFERPDVKADVIKKTEAVIGDDVVFASNTSTLPIGGLAKHSERPELFIGMHFFSPVERMPLLEIIPHDGTGDRALAVAFDYNSKIRKTPIVVKDVRGFFTNQVFPPYINEAALMVTEGVSLALIENSALNMGLPIGPLAVSDDTTLKLGYDIMRSTQEEMGKDYVPSGIEDFMENMVTKWDRAGRRFGAGFYDYDETGKRLGLWKGMTDHYPLLEDQPTQEEVQQRLMYALLVPSARTYAEGVVPDPQSADLGAIFGLGFPPWTGGPMSYIDTIGVGTFVATADMLAQRHGARFTPPQGLRDMAENGETIYGGAPTTYSKSALERMLEADVVKIANGMGIAASVDDLKADTIAKILNAQAGKKAA
ncbi:3-hydroxyacyl-CoA dehydrogenase NAD-binding domain-containing protein [Algimonas porphyrae]|uniref:3-hydroxyacyl-CoA dehydrogenase n=1 Tax=Algimonas porphyrae TaxID=1128113 RepID=A0ABQ5V1R8_9PROT|nr:3-hydroxyacyl-CoA dehydrogenase NAD-binding domain-containing protein [Algimonas porphyrae]GLQ20182.1 3-hydroxyacyl-CoA dehydrogenase [Algimonas porphyrae]